MLLAAGALLLARLPTGGDYWTDVLPGMVLLAVGSGLAYAPTYIAASSGVAVEDQGAAAGLVNSAQEIGAAVGLSGLALVASGLGESGLVEGYRAGLVGAATMFAVAAAIAGTIPRTLGRADVTAPPAHPVVEEKAIT